MTARDYSMPRLGVDSRSLTRQLAARAGRWPPPPGLNARAEVKMRPAAHSLRIARRRDRKCEMSMSIACGEQAPRLAAQALPASNIRAASA